MKELELRELVKIYPFVETKRRIIGRKKAKQLLEQQRKMPHITNEGVLAIRNLSLRIERGEFIVLLGPSGCGKTTLVRMIAGLEEVTLGEILMDGKIINSMLPEERDMAMIFQNYSIYPHFTVYENMAFPLKNLHMPREELDRTVRETARILDMEEFLNRRPSDLSGGQMQRVAIGRALVRHPRVFLMDEPFSNLDVRMRQKLRTTLKRIHESLGTTFIYVTHDQQEALALADRIVLMREGSIEQVGTSREIYNRPANLFSASFIGSPTLNVVRDARLLSEGEKWEISVLGSTISLPHEKCGEFLKKYSGEKVTMGIRPVHLKIDTDGIEARVEDVEPLGRECVIHLMAGKIPLCTVKETILGTPLPYQVGNSVRVKIPAEKLFLFDPDSGIRIL